MQVDLTVQHNPNWAGLPTSFSATKPSSDAIVQDAISISLDTWCQWFDQWLTVLNPDISPIQAYALTLRLTDDADIQALNATYRHQDCPTDVLAFAALETLIPATYTWTVLPVELGDIVISIETALTQAQSSDHSLQQELAWLASHGLLHLLGWDHPDADSLEHMLIQQRHLLAEIGLQPT